MNEFVKSLGVAAVSASAVGLIGYGSVITQMKAFSREQIENHEVNNSFYTVRADVVAMKADNLGLHRDIVRLNDRLRKTEIASAETIKVLSSVTTALNAQTKATSELTKQVIRLEVIASAAD